MNEEIRQGRGAEAEKPDGIRLGRGAADANRRVLRAGEAGGAWLRAVRPLPDVDKMPGVLAADGSVQERNGGAEVVQPHNGGDGDGGDGGHGDAVVSRVPERVQVTVEEVREAMRKLREILKPNDGETVYMDWNGRCPVCLAKVSRIDMGRTWRCPECGREGVFHA